MMNDELKPETDERKPKAKKLSLSTRLIVWLLFLLLFWFGLAWFGAEKLIVEKPLERADVILVLGGSSVYIERAQKAAELYKKGISLKIILTDDGERAGWSQAEQRNPPYVELARNELVKQGVPLENIEILQPQVSGTIDEARLLQSKLKENDWKSVLIVTSAYHTRRALRTFESTLVNDRELSIGIESPPSGQQTPSPYIWWLSPLGWKVVAGEYVKSVYYWLYY